MRPLFSLVIFCVLALAATLAIQAIWSALLVVNLQTTPALPWSVAVAAIGVWLAWEFAGGRWAHGAAREVRRRYRRAQPLPTATFVRALAAGTLALGALLFLWLVTFQLIAPPPRASIDGYPLLTVAAVLVMASVLGAVVEEVGLRGYMLGRLERVMPGAAAVFVVALVIAPGHAATQGFAWPVAVWYLLADIVFGLLAWLTDSILPGVIVHAIGLLLFFAIIWPADAARAATVGHIDASFWIELVVCAAFGVASAVAFAGLAAHRADRHPAGPMGEVAT